MKSSIHTILAHSYLSYFLASMVGLLLDSVFGFSSAVPFGETIAMICFLVGPIMIFWAQYTSRTLQHQNHDVAPQYFNYGPYRFLRNPTHLGIVVLVAGYAAVSGSVIFLGITIIGYIVSNYFFRQYEAILKETFGTTYDTYKTKIPKIF